MKTYLIYGLLDPRDSTIRYVGMSSKGMARARAHLLPSSKRRECNYKKRKWQQELDLLGLEPIPTEIEAADTYEGMCILERFWISSLRSCGAHVVNVQDGGEGCPEGFAMSVANRARISRANRSRKVSKETKIKTSKAIRCFKNKASLPQNQAFRDELGNVYDTLVEAHLALGVAKSKVSAVLLGREGHTKGHVFTYLDLAMQERGNAAREARAQAEETRKDMPHPNLGSKRTSEQCVRIAESRGMKPFCDENGHTYRTTGEAASYLGVNRTHVSEILRGVNHRKTTKGHTFTFLEETE